MDSLMKCVEYIQYLPFIGMATGHNTTGNTPIVTRLIEAAIIGGVVLYGTVKVLGRDIDYIKTEVQAIKAEQQRFRNDFYRPNLP